MQVESLSASLDIEAEIDTLAAVLAPHHWQHVCRTDQQWNRSRCQQCNAVGQHPPGTDDNANLTLPNAGGRPIPLRCPKAEVPQFPHRWKHVCKTDQGWSRSMCQRCSVVGQHPPGKDDNANLTLPKAGGRAIPVRCCPPDTVSSEAVAYASMEYAQVATVVKNIKFKTSNRMHTLVKHVWDCTASWDGLTVEHKGLKSESGAKEHARDDLLSTLGWPSVDELILLTQEYRLLVLTAVQQNPDVIEPLVLLDFATTSKDLLDVLGRKLPNSKWYTTLVKFVGSAAVNVTYNGQTVVVTGSVRGIDVYTNTVYTHRPKPQIQVPYSVSTVPGMTSAGGSLWEAGGFADPSVTLPSDPTMLPDTPEEAYMVLGVAAPVFDSKPGTWDTKFEANQTSEATASVAREILSFALDVLPVVGVAKSAQELILGQNLLMGEEISLLMGVTNVALAVVPGGKLLRKGMTKLPDVAKLRHIFRHAAGHVKPPTVSSENRMLKLMNHVAQTGTDVTDICKLPNGARNAGVRRYTTQFRNGEQVWVDAMHRKGEMVWQNGGINLVGSPHYISGLKPKP